MRGAATGRLRNAIAGGRWHPGDRLPAERDLATTLGISRAAAREALRELATQGLVEPRRGSGTYVASVNALELAEVRLAVEPLAAALAAQHHRPEHADALRAQLRALERAVGDPVLFAATDLGLHLEVVRASGNSVLERLYEQLAGLLTLSRGVTAREPGRLDLTLEQHAELVTAILARDSTGAERAMRQHIRSVARTAAERQEQEQPAGLL